MGHVIPITERSNDITQNIDKATPEEILQQLYECDLEIFNGWGGYQHVLSPETLSKLNEISTRAVQYITCDAQNAGIILGGSGTSGRIAFLISRAFNEFAGIQRLRQCYSYIISGGDHALMTSVESCEDDWNAGKRELEKKAEGLEKVLYIGITCGLSAPFVGGQVEHCLQHPEKFTPYLLGFNPANQARKVSITGTEKVMLDVALEMEAKGRLLNPILGPEPITGSSRMKGGTATKMLLEAIFLVAHQLALHQSTFISHESIIKTYQKVLNLAHTKVTEISSLIKMAGNTLVKGGAISYLALDACGIIGMIDASECVPTFGASPDDVRCFLQDGYSLLQNAQGDLSSEGDAWEISLDYFLKNKHPQLSENDMVVFIARGLIDRGTIASITDSLRIHNVTSIALVTVDDNDRGIAQVGNGVHPSIFIPIVLPSSCPKEIYPCDQSYQSYKFLDQCGVESCLKWIMNAVSTGAHIMKGKVLKNYMLDLKLTNRKLFARGISIVASFGNISSKEARECLLKSIYRQDELSSTVQEADTSVHVEKAGFVEKIIPLALLLTKKQYNVNSGLKMLEQCPVVRQCIDSCI